MPRLPPFVAPFLLLPALLLLAGVLAAHPTNEGAPLASQPHADAVSRRSLRATPKLGFVQRAGTRFVVQAAAGSNDASNRTDETCENFYFVGANTYYLMVRGSEARFRCEVDEVLDAAVELGITVIRTWGFSDGSEEWNALQRQPGVYDEETFRGLDYAIAAAGARGIRLLIAFGNYWRHFGGVDRYNAWSRDAGHGTCDGSFNCRDEFWVDPYARVLYKAHVDAVINRRNVHTGVRYRDDPTIFGWNLMNEPRSAYDLVVERRRSSDASLEYNVSSNSGDALQAWIEDMAAHVKRSDPRHLLTIGSEGFFGQSSPLYLYANPGPWAQLEGVDFVRNHRAPGIDFATMHAYVDQWLCTERGKDKQGRDSWFDDWLDAHQQAAEEELQMPVVLEEFGGKIGARRDLYARAFDSFARSAARGGGGGGVMFWILYHACYSPLDRFGGGYGEYPTLPEGVFTDSKEARHRADTRALIKDASTRLKALNSASASRGTCAWSPPVPKGEGCNNLEITQLAFGGMPWRCLPGETENLTNCAPFADAYRARLYRQPPAQWRADGRVDGDLPYNTVESLVMGKLVNAGATSVNLRGAWLVVPFSRGVHTKYEGEWTRMTDPNGEMSVMCWYASVFDANGGRALPYRGDLCRDGTLSFEFTAHAWPDGTKADRGLNVSFTKDTWLAPGHGIHAGGDGWNVAWSFKDGAQARRLDVSSLNVVGASSCPSDPDPPTRVDGLAEKWGCDHPWRACPVAVALDAARSDTKRRDERYEAAHVVTAKAASSLGSRSTAPAAMVLDGLDRGVEPETPYLVTVAVRVSRSPDPSQTVNVMTSDRVGARRLAQAADDEKTVEYIGGGRAENAEDFPPNRQILPTDAPNPEERRTSRVALGPTVIAVLEWPEDDDGSTRSFETVAVGEAPVDEWTVLRAVVSFDAKRVERIREKRLVVRVEVAERGYRIESRALTVREPTDADDEDVRGYDAPCQLDPFMAPDAILRVQPPLNSPFDAPFEVDVALCSRGYDQTVTVFEDGVPVRVTESPSRRRGDAAKPGFAGVCEEPPPGEIYCLADQSASDTCGLGDSIPSLTLHPGRTYHFVVDGRHGLPYGSFRGGCGLRITRRDGGDFFGHDFAPTRAVADTTVRAVGTRFVVGPEGAGTCVPFAFAGANAWNLMDVARYPTMRWRVDRTLDKLKERGVTVVRTWGFSLGRGETPALRAMRLHLAPGVYDESVFVGMDYALKAAGERGIKLLISLEDYWLSVDRYVEWSPTAGARTDFYTNWHCRRHYRDHVRRFFSRRNTFTGVLYRDDPAIFGWNLMNEPRCTSCGWALSAWIEEMAVFVKSLDPHHMVTIGEEGFYSSSCSRVHLNPGSGDRRTGIASSPWALMEGQDFVANHAVREIDFATTHVWPDNWLGFADYSPWMANEAFDYTKGSDVWREKLEYVERWIDAHVADAESLGKPLVVEEFGKAVPVSGGRLDGLAPGESVAGDPWNGDFWVRDEFFRAVHDAVETSVSAGGAARGSAFWVVHESDEAGGSDKDPYRVGFDDWSTWQEVRAHATNVRDAEWRTFDGVCAA